MYVFHPLFPGMKSLRFNLTAGKLHAHAHALTTTATLPLCCRGVAEAFSSQDYALLGLKKLLFFDGPVKIKQQTEYTYSVYSKLALAGSEWAQPHCWKEYHDG
jgi:hypothetical protein